MTKKLLVLALTAIAVAGANPALAHCGGSHGKSYRAATTSKKPVGGQSCTDRKREAAASAPIAETTAPAEDRDRLHHRLALPIGKQPARLFMRLYTPPALAVSATRRPVISGRAM